ncbi:MULTISPECIES: hypothetical protein [unclassified Lentimonas]|uniref:hypothetical protein n=1 Tax=unclassified Lentimonas TaxID=2630993 RepID=UPI001321089F|nr:MULTISPECIES: hypothetical protein [unclassified Lentimonas]CAA6677703.1 Unannotated [Lentimonas sp. CC4]CAA6684966.1 Unannotated [Lentimonas sp. CC6]CAA6691750.1 Unannotated [Lentimonas sp. CC19]CAA6696124.1 Unannotated [Lentimonas sp. CC10]CAA7070101.1 Unannotated [Lentimonas sp. CC11]
MRYLSLFAVLFFSFSGAFAQSVENEIRVVFTAYDWAKKGVGDVYYRSGGEYELIEMRNLSRTKPYIYNGAKLFQLFKKIPVAEGVPAEFKFQVCAETVIKQNGGRVMVVISPETSEESAFDYRIYTLEDSLDGFPKNSFRLVSFSQKTLYFQIEDRKPQKIEPGKRITIKPEKSGEGYMSAVFRSESGELLYSKKWYTEPGVRDLVFLRSYEDRRGKERLALRIITEYVTEPTKESKR